MTLTFFEIQKQRCLVPLSSARRRRDARRRHDARRRDARRRCFLSFVVSSLMVPLSVNTDFRLQGTLFL